MIVPGSLVGIDHPFAWYAVVEEIATGKEYTIWINGTQLNRESVVDWVATYCKNSKVKTIDRCTEMPTRPLQPLPPSLFEFGIRKKIEAFIQQKNAIGPRPIAIKPIVRQPL